jgi:vacuolar-type H+-ATPase subunit I/STV1
VRGKGPHHDQDVVAERDGKCCVVCHDRSDLGELRKLEAELKAALAQLRAQGGGARLEEIEQQLQLIDRRKVELKAGGKK